MDSKIFELLENHDYEPAITKIINILVKICNEYNTILKNQSDKFPNDEDNNYYYDNDYVKIDKKIIQLNTQRKFYDKLLKEITTKILE
jgi:hypothetical protein